MAANLLARDEARRIAANIADLTRADVAQLHHQFRDRPYQANRSLAVLSKMMNLAEAWGLRLDGSNPCRHESGTWRRRN